MNHPLKFAFMSFCAIAAMASAAMANIVVNPTESTLTSGSLPASGTVGDFNVTTGGKATGASVTGGSFSIANGSFTLDVIPDVTAVANTFLPSNGTYTVKVNFTGTAALTVTVEGTTLTATSGQLLTFNVTNHSTATVDLHFTGSGNSNSFAITGIDVEAPVTPEPKSILAVSLLLGAVCCTERRRIGGLIGRVSARFSGSE